VGNSARTCPGAGPESSDVRWRTDELFSSTQNALSKKSTDNRQRCHRPPVLLTEAQQRKKFMMSKEQENKAIVGRWFKEFWGNPWKPSVVDELGAPNILLQYSLHKPRRGREDVKQFMTEFRAAFPDLAFEGGLQAQRCFVSKTARSSRKSAWTMA
jgi:hypothetical protein